MNKLESIRQKLGLSSSQFCRLIEKPRGSDCLSIEEPTETDVLAAIGLEAAFDVWVTNIGYRLATEQVDLWEFANMLRMSGYQLARLKTQGFLPVTGRTGRRSRTGLPTRLYGPDDWHAFVVANSKAIPNGRRNGPLAVPFERHLTFIDKLRYIDTNEFKEEAAAVNA